MLIRTEATSVRSHEGDLENLKLQDTLNAVSHGLPFAEVVPELSKIQAKILREVGRGPYPMTSPGSRTSERRATDDERSLPVSNLKESFERRLGAHKTPEVMNVQLAEPKSMGCVRRKCEGG